jgi:ribosomal-protein-alanine N-acetyltransferase
LPWQRQGLGSKLIGVAIDRAIAQPAQTAWLEVRRSNQTAIELYQTLGFKILGQRVNCYSNKAPV